MHSLPPEIITNIVAHLDRNTCIEAIHACRQWRRAIPPCAASLWTDVPIATNDSYTLDHLEFFAPHLRSVTLLSNSGEGKLFAALSKLQTCHRIGRLKMQLASQMKHPDRLIELLSALAQPLFTLEIHSTRPLATLSQVIAACPTVTRLSYAVMPFSVAFQPKLLDHHGKHIDGGLTTLCIDTKEAAFNLYAILRHCPALVQLKVNLMVQVDLHAILRLCPSIQYLHSGPFNMWYDYDDYDVVQHQQHQHDNVTCSGNNTGHPKRGSSGVRRLVLHEYHQERRKNLATLDFILDHHATLELLHLEMEGMYVDDWQALASRLQHDRLLTRLRTLCCRSLHGCTGTHLAALIRACPNLEHVHLCRVHRLTMAVWRSLLSLRHLGKLELCIESCDALLGQGEDGQQQRIDNTSTSNGASNRLAWFFQAVGRSKMALRHLTLSSMGSLVIDHAVLFAVASTKTLEYLSLEGVESILVSPSVMAQFLKRLEQHATLQQLALTRVSCMAAETLDALLRITSLRSVTFDKCHPMTADDMLERWWGKINAPDSGGRPPSLREIRVDNRILVDGSRCPNQHTNHKYG